MDYAPYENMPNAQIPPHIAKTLRGEGGVALTPRTEIDHILTDPELQAQTGFSRMPDGSYVVAMTCDMPGVAPEMIDWWFWWHPQASERYRLWYPGEHFSIRTSKRDDDYFSSTEQPPFRPNSQFPTERVGRMRMPLRIDFTTPEQFGFSPEALQKSGVATTVCGHVGAFGGLFYHTEMVHVFFEREGGLFMVSRFWIGATLENKQLRRLMLTDETARGMAEHCCMEYRNLRERLPELYRATRA